MATRSDSKFISFNGQSLVFPTGTGVSNQVLSTNGSGVLSWGSVLLATGGILTGNLSLQNYSELRFYDNDSSNYVSLVAPLVVSSDIQFKLPAVDGQQNYVLRTDGQQNLTFANAEILLSTTTGINGLSAATTNLYTVPTGKSAIITRAILRLTATSAITGRLNAGIGIAAGEDDIFSSRNLTGFNTTGEIYIFLASGTLALAQSTNVIKLGIDTAFSGTTATLAIDLIGYLV